MTVTVTVTVGRPTLRCRAFHDRSPKSGRGPGRGVGGTQGEGRRLPRPREPVVLVRNREFWIGADRLGRVLTEVAVTVTVTVTVTTTRFTVHGPRSLTNEDAHDGRRRPWTVNRGGDRRYKGVRDRDRDGDRDRRETDAAVPRISRQAPSGEAVASRTCSAQCSSNLQDAIGGLHCATVSQRGGGLRGSGLRARTTGD